MIKFKTKPISPTKSPAEAGKKVKAETAGGGADHEPAFVIKDFAQNYILYHIHKNGTRTSPPRHHNVVHASDLDPFRKWCAREPALLTLHDKKRPGEFTSTAQRMVWQMGYKGAELVMDMVPKEQQWGNWKCRGCKGEIKYAYRPKACPHCGGDHPRILEYQEVFLRDPKTGVVGSVDLFVDILGNGVKTALEIKTEGNDSFKARTKAEFDHEWRTMLYCRLIEANWDGEFAAKHHINTQTARIIYVTKEGHADSDLVASWGLVDWKKSAMKEYFVTRDDSMTQNQMDYAMSYRQWRNSWDASWEGAGPMGKVEAAGLLPDRVKGAKSPGCTRCKKCPVKKECWKGTA